MNYNKKQILEKPRTVLKDSAVSKSYTIAWTEDNGETYMKEFMAKLKRSEDDFKNGRVYTLEQIDKEMEELYASDIV